MGSGSSPPSSNFSLRALVFFRSFSNTGDEKEEEEEEENGGEGPSAAVVAAVGPHIAFLPSFHSRNTSRLYAAADARLSKSM